jgi:hypothetical protein
MEVAIVIFCVLCALFFSGFWPGISARLKEHKRQAQPIPIKPKPKRHHKRGH